MSASIKKNDCIAIVAQTPFQLFSAILIRAMSAVDADLWLIDPGLRAYQQPCIDLGVWRNVFYLEVNKGAVGKSTFFESLLRFRKIRLIQAEIRRYMSRIKPSAIVIFSDNHEVSAAFARIGKGIARARIIIVEEGSAVYFSYKRAKASLPKQLLRWVMGIDNPKGYTIGWSPNIDTVIVSDVELAHADYLQARQAYQFPSGPYPSEVAAEFYRLLPVDSLIKSFTGRDIVFLGQPGVLPPLVEMEILSALDESDFASRIIVKPHPFDVVGKYAYLKNIALMSEEMWLVPAEVVFEAVRPSVVVSVFSSAVFNYCVRNNSSGIFHAPAGLSSEIVQLLDVWVSKSDNIKMTHSVSELLSAIDAALMENKPEILGVEAPINSWRDVVCRALSN